MVSTSAAYSLHHNVLCEDSIELGTILTHEVRENEIKTMKQKEGETLFEEIMQDNMCNVAKTTVN